MRRFEFCRDNYVSEFSLSSRAFSIVDLASSTQRTCRDWHGTPSPVGRSDDGIFCVTSVPRHSHTPSDRMGIAASPNPSSGDQRFSLATGTVRAAVVATSAQPRSGGLAQPLSGARLPAHWKTAITAGHLAVVSAADKSARLTTESALERNDLVARLAKTIVIAHASAAGVLSARCDLWVSHGLSVTKLTDL